MWNRREFLYTLASGALSACSYEVTEPTKMTARERVDRALGGEEVDRPPFTFYYHFGLENLPGEHHARATLEFHRKFRTDLVKVMSDFPYPRPGGNWYELEVADNPFPEQIRALEIIQEGLQGECHFIETVFSPWNQAGKLSSPEEVQRLKLEDPQKLVDGLEAIAKSEANHARLAVEAGASGIFLAIANAQEGILTPEEYETFCEPFDRMVLDAVRAAPLNTLHLHGDKVYLERFFSGWPATVVQYSVHGTGVSMGEVRRKYDGVLMGGIDERDFRSLSEPEMRGQWQSAHEAVGSKFILAPGCSVPNDTTDEELMQLVNLLGA